MCTIHGHSIILCCIHTKSVCMCKHTGNFKIILGFRVALGLIVFAVCIVSFYLTIRALMTSYKLAKVCITLKFVLPVNFHPWFWFSKNRQWEYSIMTNFIYNSTGKSD